MNKTKNNITSYVEFGNNDDECLPITRCICGKKFVPWDFTISIYDDVEYINECPNCKRKMFFRNEIQVYEIVDLVYKGS